MQDLDTRLRGAPELPVDQEQLADLVRDQRGLVTRAQCLAAGLTAKAIEVRLVRGSWRRLHRGVYLTVPGRDDWWTAATAAHLACGSSAAWSHDTAAYVWGLVPRPGPLIDVLIDDSRRVAQPVGVRVHRSLHADRRCDPLIWPWRTTVEETILDLSAVGTLDQTYALLGRAFQRHLTGEATLLARLADRHSHRHHDLIVAALSDVADGAESAMEIRYARDVERAHALPRGRRQSVTEATTAPLRFRDVTYDAQRTIVELDGRLGHDQAADRVRDGLRDRDNAASGWVGVRAFWPEVAGAPCRLAVDIGAVLTTRGWAGRPRSCRRTGCVVGAR